MTASRTHVPGCRIATASSIAFSTCYVRPFISLRFDHLHFANVASRASGRRPHATPRLQGGAPASAEICAAEATLVSPPRRQSLPPAHNSGSTPPPLFKRRARNSAVPIGGIMDDPAPTAALADGDDITRGGFTSACNVSNHNFRGEQRGRLSSASSATAMSRRFATCESAAVSHRHRFKSDGDCSTTETVASKVQTLQQR